METVMYFGGPLKALGNGKLGGWLVTFTSADAPDLSGDYFTKSTEFFVEDGHKLPILYDHGLDPILKRRKIGMGTVTSKEAGLWLEIQLARRDDYEKAIEQMALEGKAGLSSGAAGHLVSRVKGKKASEITEWGLAEGSITPCPAQPTHTLMSLKSYEEAHTPIEFAETEPPSKSAPTGMLAARLSARLEDLVDDGRSREEIVKTLAQQSVLEIGEVEKVLSGETRRPVNATLKAFGRVLNMPFKMLKELVDKGAPKAIKDLFAEELAGRTPSTWELQSIFCCVVKKIAEAAKSARAVGTEYDYAPQVKEAASSYLDALSDAALAQVQMYVDGESTSEYGDEFYLRSLSQLTQDDFAAFSKGIDLAEHSQLVVTAVRDYMTRMRNNHEARKSHKAGRVLSEKNRLRLAAIIDELNALVSEATVVMEESQPMATDTEMRAALTKHLFLKHERRKNGLQLGA